MAADVDPADELRVGPLNLESSGFLTRSEFELHWERLIDAGDSGVAQHINPASVDLHLGGEYFVTSVAKPGLLTEDSPYLTIPHGEFALLMTAETVRVPEDLIALITMRFTYKREGLINISGFHVDPGFTGRLVYSVYNAGSKDITLKFRDRVFTIFYTTLVQATKSYNGNSQGQDGLSAELVSALSGPPINLERVRQRLDRLEAQLESYFRTAGAVLVGIGIALFASILGILIREFV